MKHILRCSSCNTYTMKEICTECGKNTIMAKPPKYSPADKYAKYRRQIKFEERREADFL